MRLTVDHLRVDAVEDCKLKARRLARKSPCGKVQSETHIVDKLAFGLGHGGQNLNPLVGGHEPALSGNVSCPATARDVKVKGHILSKGLLHQLDELSVMPGKGHELVRIRNVAVRFVCVRVDAECLRKTTVALCDLAFVRTARGKGSLPPS